MTGLKKVIIVGDSHSNIWRPGYRKLILNNTFTVVENTWATSKTAQGLAKQENLNIFLKKLRETKEDIDYFIIQLGEVDCAYALWSRMNRNGTTKETEVDFAIKQLENLAINARKYTDKIILLSPIIPIIEAYKEGTYRGSHGHIQGRERRNEIKATHKERTDLCLLFERKLKDMANINGFKVASINHILLDKTTGLIKKQYMNLGDSWHLKIKDSIRLWVNEISKTIERDIQETRLSLNSREKKMFFKYIPVERNKISRYNDLYYKNIDLLIPVDFIDQESTVICCGARGDLCLKNLSAITRFLKAAKHVVVVEADSRNTKTIEKYTQDNKIDNISIINKVIWNNKTKLEFISLQNATSGRVGSAKDKPTKVLKTTTLNTVAKDLERVDLIDLTINGAELNAIHGARRMMKKHSPDISIAFLGRSDYMFKPRMEAIKLLEKAGYHIGFRVTKDLKREKDIRNKPIETWEIKDCHGFAIATKDRDKLIRLGFEEGSN